MHREFTEDIGSSNPVTIIGGFESTYLPTCDLDVAEITGHDIRRRADLELLRSCGVTSLRYPVRWHRIETRPGRFDWAETDHVFALLDEMGFLPIVDLVHHTSYPQWLDDGFADPAFPHAYLRYVESFARRYADVGRYTLFNEPFSTVFLCGHEGAWPPYQRGIEPFVRMLGNVLPAVCAASHICAELLPGALHVWTDSCERHTGSGRSGRRYAEYANDRRFFVLDAFLGRAEASEGTFAAAVERHGGDALFDLDAGHVDVLGLDYYAHCQWHFGPVAGTAPSAVVAPFADLIEEYAHRYSVPVIVTETNLRGTASDRATWFKYVLEQCEIAVTRGVDVQGLCWFPFIDSSDWDSLLRFGAGSLDPVGAVSLRADLTRVATTMTDAFSAAAQGARAADLPAFLWQPPVSNWLDGYTSHVPHWKWLVPPEGDVMPWTGSTSTDFGPLDAAGQR